MKSILNKAFCLFLVLCLPASVHAEYIDPATLKVKTESFSFEEEGKLNSLEGDYHYDISWQGIPVASAVLKVDETLNQGKPMFSVSANVKTNGAISLLYKLRHSSESYFWSDTLKPLMFYSEQRENSKNKKVQIKYNDDGSVDSFYHKHKREPKLLKFNPNNLMLDPITASFLAKSLPIRKDNPREFDVFNGNHRYIISFEFVEEEEIKVAGKRYKAFKLKPNVEKLTDTKGERRIREAYLWVSADDERRILKLESEVLIGSVVAKLDEFKPEVKQALSAETPEYIRARLASVEPK